MKILTVFLSWNILELKEVIKVNFADYLPIWNELTSQQKAHIESASETRKVSKGTILYNGNIDCLGLVLVCSGQIRAYILSDEGREVTISRFFEYDICFFSASCVMPSMQFNIVVEAEKDSEICIIPACLYKNLMDESMPVMSYSNKLISGSFSDLMWLVEQIMWKSIDKRLAAFLLEESAVEGSNVLPITHEKIGNHMGTAREVVTRMLKYFQSEGMVKLTRGTVEITDEGKLRDLCE